MFKTRLLSGIVLVIILIATVGCGGEVLFGVLGVISLIGMTELYKVVGCAEETNCICRLSGSSSLLCTSVYGIRLNTFAATDHGIYDRIDGSVMYFRILHL